VAETELKEEVESEVKSSSEVPPVEEKTSAPIAKIERETEEKTSAKGKRLRQYNGLGRKTNDDEMDEILDAYLQYGILPKNVSERQRRDYKKHPRLELRRLYLEQAGLIKKGRTGTTAKARKADARSNVLPMRRRKA
jgi:hypothetical protein